MKTDRIDAEVIARFAADLKPEVGALNDPETLRIKDLLARRRQIVTMRTMEKNRHQVMPEVAQSSICRMIEVLDEELEHIERRLDEAIAENSQTA